MNVLILALISPNCPLKNINVKFSTLINTRVKWKDLSPVLLAGFPWDQGRTGYGYDPN